MFRVVEPINFIDDGSRLRFGIAFCPHVHVRTGVIRGPDAVCLHSATVCHIPVQVYKGKYKIEQKRRKPKERYEYSVERTAKIYEKDKYYTRLRKIQEELLQQKEDERRNNYLNLLQKIDNNHSNTSIGN